MEHRRELKPERREKVAAMSAEDLWASWQRCFPLLTHFVTDLYHRMETFKDLVAVVRANPATLKPPVLFNWIRDNYLVAECMAIRRLLDVDERSTSLGRLLREIEIRPELVSRAQYRGLVDGKGPSPHEADKVFDRLVGESGDQITSAMVAADITRLEAAEKNIRKLVNKRFAHASPFTAMAKFPVFEEVEVAIEELDQIVVKYDSLIHGGFLSTAHAAKLNWKQPLAVAWIDPTKGGGAARYEGPKHRGS
jgi:hypothetical protein